MSRTGPTMCTLLPLVDPRHDNQQHAAAAHTITHAARHIIAGQPIHIGRTAEDNIQNVCVSRQHVTISARVPVPALGRAVPSQGMRKPTMTEAAANNDMRVAVTLAFKNRNGGFQRNAAQADHEAAWERIDASKRVVLAPGDKFALLFKGAGSSPALVYAIHAPAAAPRATAIGTGTGTGTGSLVTGSGSRRRSTAAAMRKRQRVSAGGGSGSGCSSRHNCAAAGDADGGVRSPGRHYAAGHAWPPSSASGLSGSTTGLTKSDYAVYLVVRDDDSLEAYFNHLELACTANGLSAMHAHCLQAKGTRHLTLFKLKNITAGEAGKFALRSSAGEEGVRAGAGAGKGEQTRLLELPMQLGVQGDLGWSGCLALGIRADGPAGAKAAVNVFRQACAEDQGRFWRVVDSGKELHLSVYRAHGRGWKTMQGELRKLRGWLTQHPGPRLPFVVGTAVCIKKIGADYREGRVLLGRCN